jgi:hypothetical protein
MRAAWIGALRGHRQPAAPDPEELALMRWLDEQYLATPFYGSRRITAELRKADRQVNRKLPGSEATSRMKGSRRNLGDLTPPAVAKAIPGCNG